MLTAFVATPGGRFGLAVAVNGDTAVIGAPEWNNHQGAAYVFVRSGSTWIQQQQLIAPDGMGGLEANADHFGASVAVSGDTAMSGAIHKGVVYAFVRSRSSWTLQQELQGTISGFGIVSLQGDTALIGSDLEGVAYIYMRSGTTWTQQQKLTPSGGAGFVGAYVSLSGTTALISAQNTGNNQQGAAYVFVVQAVSAVSVTPNSGTGLSQTFTAVYSDNAGATDLQVVYLDIDGGIGAPHSCFVAYLQATNKLYLFNDTNSGVSSSLTPGSANSVSNSQCSLSGAGSGVVALMGQNLTVAFAITFQSGYSGAKNVYGLAQSYNGTSSGSVLLGTWTATHPAPTAVSVSPINGSGAGQQTFSALYTDSAGASDVQVVYLLFGSSQANACFVAYVPFGNALYLFNDADTGVVAGSPIMAGGTDTLSNSQCILSGAGGTATLAGNNFTAPFKITFQTTFTGTHNVYGIVQSYDGTRSALTLLGTWTLLPPP